MAGTTIHPPVRRFVRLGFLFIIVGVLLAADALFNLSFIYRLWPLLLVLPGVGFLGFFIHRSRKESFYIGAGVFILGISLLALYCSLNSWSSLSHLWPLFITITGLSFCSGYFFGQRIPVILLFGLFLISLSITFFLTFSINPKLWWSVFILTGFCFMAFDRANRLQ